MFVIILSFLLVLFFDYIVNLLGLMVFFSIYLCYIIVLFYFGRENF